MQRRDLIRKPAANPNLWKLERNIVFLNHGSFGACPKRVLAYQQSLRDRMEAEPVRFFVRELEAMLDEARAALAKFLGANPRDLVFVPSATAGVNTVLRSLHFRSGDELLVTNHEYNACRNALEYAAYAAGGAKVVVARIPFPLRSSDEVIERVIAKVTRKTRLALLDHVTSQTALIFPIEKLVREFERRGVAVLVDGAHAPGMVPLKLEELGASYYTGNCHKWLCAPKGAGFLHVRNDRQQKVRPLSISHGANSPRQDRSRFLIEFGWTGTWDPSAMLSVPEALRVMESLLPGGWPAIMKRNRDLAVAARRLLLEAMEIEAPCPEEMLGSMAALPLPDAQRAHPVQSPLYLDLLQDQLLEEYQIEIPVIPWPKFPKRLLRISAQLYNKLSDYKQLAAALNASLETS